MSHHCVDSAVDHHLRSLPRGLRVPNADGIAECRVRVRNHMGDHLVGPRHCIVQSQRGAERLPNDKPTLRTNQLSERREAVRVAVGMIGSFVLRSGRGPMPKQLYGDRAKAGVVKRGEVELPVRLTSEDSMHKQDRRPRIGTADGVVEIDLGR